MNSLRKKERYILHKYISVFVLCTFLLSTVFPPQLGFAQTNAQTVLHLPVPGAMVSISQPYVPVLLKGMTIHPDNPLRFDFIIDSGYGDINEQELRAESERLVKYFLASMTIPKNDLWVNLSPYEGDRIIPDELSKTELGRDLLAQDYLLKQLTSTLMHPDKELGKEFWARIYKRAEEEFGTTDIPLDTFNKVWIIPERASVYEHEQTVYVVDAHLKVMLAQDYLAMKEENVEPSKKEKLSAQIVRDIILPEIEQEVNTGKNFSPLRQIYYSLILAKWYKESLKDSLLSHIYVNQNKVIGVDSVDANVKNEIYRQYISAYKTGVFNFIKEDYDRLTGKPLPRKYFSGGIKDEDITIDRLSDQAMIAKSVTGRSYLLNLEIQPHSQGSDAAMLGNWLKNRKVRQLIVEKLDDKTKTALITEFHIKEASEFLDEGDDFDVVYHEQIDSGEIIGVLGADGLYWGADVDADTGRSVNFRPARLEIVRGKSLEQVDEAMLIHFAKLRDVGRSVLNIPFVSKFKPESSWLPSLKNLSAAIVIVGLCTACAVNPAKSPLVHTGLGEEYLEQVIKDLESDYSPKRAVAYFYILSLGPDDTFALTSLNSALASDLSEESKNHISRAIAKITFVDPQSMPSLIQVIEDETSTDDQLLNAYRRLKDMGWTPRILEEQVMSHYFNIEWDKIVEIGQPAIPVLVGLLPRPDRAWAARILNDLRWTPQTLEEKLYFYLGRDQVDNIRALGAPTIPLLSRIVTSADAESQVSRSTAVRALGLFTGEDEAMKLLIRKAAVDPDPIIRAEAEEILLGSQRSVKLSGDQQSGQVIQLNAVRGRFSEPYLLNDFLDKDSPSRVNSARLLANLTVTTESMKQIIEAVQVGDQSLDQPLKWQPNSWKEEQMPGVRNLLARLTADFWNDRQLLADYILPTIFDVLMEQPTHFMTIDIMIKTRRLVASMDEAAYQQVYQRLNTRDQQLWRVFYLVSRFDGSHYHQPPYAGVDLPELVNQDFQDGRLQEALEFLEEMHPEFIGDFLIGYMSDTRGSILDYGSTSWSGLPARDVYLSYVRHALLVSQSTVLKLLYRDGRILQDGNYRGVQATQYPSPDKDILDAYQSPEVVWTDRDVSRLRGLLKSPIEYYRDAARRALDAIEGGEGIIPYDKDEAMLTDNAQLTDVGGIDMNEINVDREGSVNIQFRQEGFEELLKIPIDGFTPEIINIAPLPSILSLLGLTPYGKREDFEVTNLD